MIWARMIMTGSREGFGNDKPLWKQRRGYLLQLPDHKATEKENSGKNLGETKEKEKAKNQAVTNLTPLKKSRPRDLVAQGYIGLRKPFPTRVSFFLYCCSH